MSTTTTTVPTARLSAAPVYRLTRRGRLVVFLLAFAVVVAVGVAFAGGSMATGEPEATETVVVEPGQTLWEIASDLGGGDDTRAMVRHLVELNDLDSVVLDAGQTLAVPVD